MLQINENITTTGVCFGQQYMLHRGLKKFGRRGDDDASKELKQLHDRKCLHQEILMKLHQEREGKLWMH